jgi:hypothetical protein
LAPSIDKRAKHSLCSLVRKYFFCSILSEFENFLLCERILINVTTCQNETSMILSDVEPLRGSTNKKTTISSLVIQLPSLLTIFSEQRPLKFNDHGKKCFFTFFSISLILGDKQAISNLDTMHWESSISAMRSCTILPDFIVV